MLDQLVILNLRHEARAKMPAVLNGLEWQTCLRRILFLNRTDNAALIAAADTGNLYPGSVEVYRGHELTVNLLQKVQLQIAVNEDFVEPTVNAIMEAARTGPEGRIGDGKIFILPLEDCIRIRTGESGPEAI